MDARARSRAQIEPAALTDRLRAGQLDRRAVVLAAQLGHPAAREALGGPWPPLELDAHLNVLKRVLVRNPRRVLVAEVAALARPLFPLLETADSNWGGCLTSIERWIETEDAEIIQPVEPDTMLRSLAQTEEPKRSALWFGVVLVSFLTHPRRLKKQPPQRDRIRTQFWRAQELVRSPAGLMSCLEPAAKVLGAEAVADLLRARALETSPIWCQL